MAKNSISKDLLVLPKNLALHTQITLSFIRMSVSLFPDYIFKLRNGFPEEKKQHSIWFL